MEYHIKTKKYIIREIKVQAKTLSNVIEEHNIAVPDVLNIDVEGHEREVILSIPFQEWKPKMLLIESTYPNTEMPTFDQWEDLIIASGYNFYLTRGVNRFYIL
ncbi:MAG: FkbM family methyltransferase [Candidatus Dadabacteria bacterium]|nr:FkbM family methyltransferase [Candidatus Dadabacteria bacterium]